MVTALQMVGRDSGAWKAPNTSTGSTTSPDKNDTILMGANTYRLMSSFAEAGEEQGMTELTAASKVVFSSTLDEPLAWANTRLVSGTRSTLFAR